MRKIKVGIAGGAVTGSAYLSRRQTFKMMIDAYIAISILDLVK